ncbi:MAG: VTT domain-containing protein [Bacteroidota bacterium]
MTLYAKIKAINRYYRITKFYTFLKDTSIKAGISVLIIGFILLGLEHFFLDFNLLLDKLITTFTPQAILAVFTISETFLGLIPPEIFIAWSVKSAEPLLFLLFLASLSYIAGIFAYLIGKLLFRIKSIRNHLENKISGHIINLRKWGGFFVFVGAMLPIPHSVVSMACGLIKYDFRYYLLWALFRYLRFGIYALVIFQVF